MKQRSLLTSIFFSMVAVIGAAMIVGGGAMLMKSIYFAPQNYIKGILGTIICLFFGIIFVLVSFSMLFGNVTVVGPKRRLVVNKTKIYADFDRIEMNTSTKVNGKHPYVVFCCGQIPDGEVMEFKSENIWYDPTRKIEDRGIKKIPVYVNPNRPKKYYVSLEELEGKNWKLS